jgi:predicted Zn-dependent protease
VTVAGLAVLLFSASTSPQAAPASPAAPPSVKALLQRARTQLEQKNAPAALQSLRRARTLAPNSEEVLFTYAEAALLVRSPLEAVTVLEALVRMSPTVAAYRYRLGVTLLDLGDAEAAVASLRAAERLEPDRAASLVALGTALNRLGLYAEAKLPLLRASSLDPDGLDAMAALAEAEQGLGERDAATARAQRVLVRTGTHPLANLVLGSLELERGRFAEARDALLKADPDLPVVQEQLSRVYAKLNDPTHAREHEELARRKKKEREDRVQEVRRVTGFPTAEPKS